MFTSNRPLRKFFSVTMAKANLEMVRAKVAAEGLKTVMDVDRTRRVLELTRRVASMQRAMTPRDQDPGPRRGRRWRGPRRRCFRPNSITAWLMPR